MNRYFILLSIAAILLLTLPAVSWSAANPTETKNNSWQTLLADVVGHYPLPSIEAEDDTPQKGRLSIPKNWEFDVGMQRFLMSHTSYEIGNSDPPFQAPLSRLEFPLNTWWIDLRLRRTCPRWSLGARSGFRVASNTDGRMKDSDWENPNVTDMLTTYSEGACDMNQGFLFRGDVDVNIADWLGLPSSFEIRPLFAFQFQRFVLTDHDGVQWSVGTFDEDDELELDGAAADLTQALPGNTIRFRQDYYLYQIGVRGSYDIKLHKNLSIKVRGEADWGPAVGYNEDRHLLRPGNMECYMKNTGDSMYFATGLDMVIMKAVTVGITMDYSWIRLMRGETRQYNAPTGDNQKWTNGVKVWSDQTSLIAHVAYAF